MILLCRKRAKTGCEQSHQGSPYSITASAALSTPGGTSRPSALAVCRLMTNSNLVDCNTGRSAGLRAVKDSTSVGSDLTKHVRTIGRVAHQPADFDNLTTGIGRGNPIARGERRKLDAPAGKEDIASDAPRRGRGATR